MPVFKSKEIAEVSRLLGIDPDRVTLRPVSRASYQLLIQGKPSLELQERFLSELKKRLPAYYCVALGVIPRRPRESDREILRSLLQQPNGVQRVARGLISTFRVLEGSWLYGATSKAYRVSEAKHFLGLHQMVSDACVPGVLYELGEVFRRVGVCLELLAAGHAHFDAQKVRAATELGIDPERVDLDRHQSFRFLVTVQGGLGAKRFWRLLCLLNRYTPEHVTFRMGRGA